MRFTLALSAAMFLAAFDQSFAQTKPLPTVSPAIDAVIAAFDHHPLVGIADAHGLAQEEDFYVELVRDPRFASKVQDILVEFGSASDQNIMDRYVDGQDVSYTELRKVWTDTVGWAPPPFDVGYANFFAQVRATNWGLAPANRLHVWLGDPPVNWSSLHTRADFKPSPGFRDSFPAEILERKVLSQGHNALVIYGNWHFNTDGSLVPLIGPAPSLATLIKQHHPDAWFEIVPYDGFMDKACATEFEKQTQDWPRPSVAMPIAGTTLDDSTFREKCPKGPHEPIPAGVSKEQMPQLIDHFERFMAGLNADALLYLGPYSNLTKSPLLADSYLDEAYQREVMDHMALVGPPGATPRIMRMTPDRNTAAPRPYNH